jgi:hypothetical protein
MFGLNETRQLIEGNSRIFLGQLSFLKSLKIKDSYLPSLSSPAPSLPRLCRRRRRDDDADGANENTTTNNADDHNGADDDDDSDQDQREK